ncbi:hypothetical protein WKH50_19155 [Pantoea agglomerans]|uniref:hypothetical protein n=1 Tax=Enterobacter agglomerans TaxID=549 RepID=UPI0007E5808C|nr:hypothetical protein [Pantoea agglomerans]WHU86700.1 hypothetical protein A7P62_12440 [Pantoea agglomerans pv. gypsophilae]
MRKIEGTKYYEHGDYEIYVGDDGVYVTKKTISTWTDSQGQQHETVLSDVYEIEGFTEEELLQGFAEKELLQFFTEEELLNEMTIEEHNKPH